MGTGVIISVTSSDELPQYKLLIVHLNTVVLPSVNPVTVVVGDVLSVITALPLTRVHTPVPIAGVLPVIVTVVTLQSAWSTPASAALGGELIFIVTVSVVTVHVPLLILHIKAVLVPGVKPVMVVLGDAALLIVQLPVTMLQLPAPVTAVLADMAVLVTLHRFWSAPASAAVGKASFVIDTSSVLELQKPLLMVHLNSVVVPAPKPVMPVVDNVAVLIVHVPLTILHTPVPITGVLPLKLAMAVLHSCWSEPASATVAGSDTVMVTSSDVAVHVPLVMVHRKVVVVPAIKSLIAVVAELLTAIVQLPVTILQLPVPTPAVFADIAVPVVLHSSWSGPASAIVPNWSIVMVTSSLEETQLPLLIVHLNTALVPAVNPVIPVPGLPAVVMVAEPDCNVHKPVPISAVLADNAVVVTLHNVWSDPASAVVGISDTIILTSSLLPPHPPLLIVHLKTVVVPAVKSLIPVV